MHYPDEKATPQEDVDGIESHDLSDSDRAIFTKRMQ